MLWLWLRLAVLPPAPAPSLVPGTRGRDRGASAVEYGLLISGVAAVIALAVFVFGGHVGNLFSGTCASLATRATSTGC